MCDTLIALAGTTETGMPILAKNSDRPPNEAQLLDWIPERSYQPGESLRCTYLEIPQISHTWAVLLSRPSWMWGAEMGLNQHGLAIGNEAVFSKIPANKQPALLGMDLLRLGLERAATAPEAVDVITALLEEFGQGGSHAELKTMYYHNSYLIADPRESWVLETIGKHWVANQVDPLYSISNLLSLDGRWDRSSAGLEDFILSQGLARSREDIRLAKNLSDLIYTTFADGRSRCARSRALLEKDRGRISIASMASALRDHGGKIDPVPGFAGAQICMHAGLGPIRVSQTTASLIASLEQGNPLAFATGTSAPCTGIFKPVWVDAPPELGPAGGGTFNPDSVFWAHERLHREVIRNYPERMAAYQNERDALEAEFIRGAVDVHSASREERRAYSQACFDRARQAEKAWLDKVSRVPTRAYPLHRLAWNGFNHQAGFQ